MEFNQNHGLSTKSRKFWIILFSFFVVIMILTMLKDWWLTKDEPNVFFYIFVPILSIIGGVLSMYGVAKISNQTITYLTLLAISLWANIMMQIVENIMKIIYYRIWEYPGYLYFVLVIPLGFLLMVFGLIWWGKVKSWMAVMLASAYFVGSLIIGLILTDMIGLTTPGS